jgi:hypothetical protein
VLEQVLELLGKLCRRTTMYVCPVEIATVQSYLHGLETGCAFGGLKVTHEVYVAAAAARGWKFRSTGIVWHMQAKGLSEDAIIQELIAVEAEAFRRAAARRA